MDMIWSSTVWRKRSLPEIRSNEERKGFSVAAENPFWFTLICFIGILLAGFTGFFFARMSVLVGQLVDHTLDDHFLDIHIVA